MINNRTSINKVKTCILIGNSSISNDKMYNHKIYICISICLGFIQSENKISHESN